jgi:hypothetical protein
MDKNLSDQRRKLEEVRLWLQSRVGSECSPEVRGHMFECWRLIGFASIALETTNFLTNGEYNDSESYRSKSAYEPSTSQGFGGS